MSDVGKDEQREDPKPARARGWHIVNFDALKNPPIAVAASVYLFATLFALAVLVLVGFGLFASFQIDGLRRWSRTSTSKRYYMR